MDRGRGKCWVGSPVNGAIAGCRCLTMRRASAQFAQCAAGRTRTAKSWLWWRHTEEEEASCLGIVHPRDALEENLLLCVFYSRKCWTKVSWPMGTPSTKPCWTGGNMGSPRHSTAPGFTARTARFRASMPLGSVPPLLHTCIFPMMQVDSCMGHSSTTTCAPSTLAGCTQPRLCCPSANNVGMRGSPCSPPTSSSHKDVDGLPWKHPTWERTPPSIRHRPSRLRLASGAP